MGISEKLLNIQKDLKCNKGQYNSFGKYRYRSCEDILEAVKPLLAREKCCLFITDDIHCAGDRIYIKATANIKDCESGEVISNCAFARESNSKKGQDESQVTGTASSYARKYCLNGMFLIDDTKDADTDEYKNESQARQNKQEPPRIASDSQIKALVNTINKKNLNLQEVLYKAKVDSLEQLTPEKYNRIVMVIKDM